MNINALKNMSIRAIDLETAIGAMVELKTLASGYSDLQLETPTWIGDKIVEIDSEIKVQVRAERQAKLLKLKAQEAALMSRDERRAAIKDQIAELEASMK